MLGLTDGVAVALELSITREMPASRVPFGMIGMPYTRKSGCQSTRRSLNLFSNTAMANFAGPMGTSSRPPLSIREAASVTEGWRLDGCTLFVTLEPCAMCAGAIVLARLDRVVFGAADPKAGFAGSLGNLVKDPRLNHEATVIPGVLAEECGDLLRAFFQARR